MTHPDFDKTQLLELIAEVLDGSLDDAGREALNGLLRTSSEARRFFSEHMALHARLHLDYTSCEVAEFLPGLKPTPRPSRFSRFSNLRLVALTAAACIALLASLFWPRQPEIRGFATLESSSAARWDGSDLPTEDGTRLGKGTLHLAEGLVTLRFDSGAQVSLEAPVELTLMDEMNFFLHNGIAVSEVPKSAIGFRISTPFANVVDCGTRFSVSVDSATGRTETHVHKGLVKVEHPASGAVVSLQAGQMNLADKNSLGEAREWNVESSRSGSVGPAVRGPGWTLLETVKDAYIGDATDKGVMVPRSETLLLVKGSKRLHVERKAYLGFDLVGKDLKSIEDAELTLHFAPTGLGLASDVPDATFTVYGLLVDEPWEEKSIKVGNAPATTKSATLENNKIRELGKFFVEQGVQQGQFGIQGEALAAFLREHASSKVTLIVVRDTVETQQTGLVHGFASHRHPSLPAPTLAIRTKLAK